MGVLIEVFGWTVIGIGVLGIVTQAVSLSPPSHRPGRGPGRHVAPVSEPVIERAKPEERANEWRQLRLIAIFTLFGPAILLDGLSSKPFDPTRDPAKWLVLAAMAAVVIWELRSWLQFTDPTERRKAFRSARLNLIPAASEVFVLLGGWKSGPEQIGFAVVIPLLLIGPDVELWVRRRLQRRAGGTTPT